MYGIAGRAMQSLAYDLCIQFASIGWSTCTPCQPILTDEELVFHKHSAEVQVCELCVCVLGWGGVQDEEEGIQNDEGPITFHQKSRKTFSGHKLG